CRHCARPKWRLGGASTLGRHLDTVHGLHNRRDFPAVQLLDQDGTPVDFDGAPVPRTNPDADGLLRVRLDVNGVAR
ncbi:MAG: hypothetical protein ACRD0P_31290, partial [Stackebrandtia sp.]